MVKQAVKVNLYAIVDRAVEEGLRFGVRRAFKYTDKPSLEAIEHEAAIEVMNALSEVIQFGNNQ